MFCLKREHFGSEIIIEARHAIFDFKNKFWFVTLMLIEFELIPDVALDLCDGDIFECVFDNEV